jgi:hypothetical protein
MASHLNETAQRRPGPSPPAAHEPPTIATKRVRFDPDLNIDHASNTKPGGRISDSPRQAQPLNRWTETHQRYIDGCLKVKKVDELIRRADALKPKQRIFKRQPLAPSVPEAPMYTTFKRRTMELQSTQHSPSSSASTSVDLAHKATSTTNTNPYLVDLLPPPTGRPKKGRDLKREMTYGVLSKHRRQQQGTGPSSNQNRDHVDERGRVAKRGPFNNSGTNLLNQHSFMASRFQPGQDWRIDVLIEAKEKAIKAAQNEQANR